MSLAVVGLGADGSADYGFHVLGAADWQWTDDELAACLPERTGDPARRLDLQLDRARLRAPSPGWSSGCTATAALISVDPNIRPMLADGPVGATLGNSAAVVGERLDRLVARADVVKVSAEDLDWLDPDAGADLDAAAQRWAERGAALVCSPTAGRRCGSPARAARCCTGSRRG